MRLMCYWETDIEESSREISVPIRGGRPGQRARGGRARGGRARLTTGLTRAITIGEESQGQPTSTFTPPSLSGNELEVRQA